MTIKKHIYFENLDGLRFLCFLSVFLYHSFHTEINEIKTHKLYNFITNDIFSNGNIGVNFFFVLSGFLITFLLIEEKKINSQINLIYFWIRRILRIWPLFFFCVFFGFVIFPYLKTLFSQESSETADLIYYLTFTNNFDIIKNGLPDSSVLGVLWSIAIEEQFYLLWPIIVFFFPVRKLWIPFLIIIFSSLIYRYLNPDLLLYEYHSLSCIGDMTTGAIGAWLISEFKNIRLKIENLSRYYIAIIYIIFFFFFFFRTKLLYQNLYVGVFERLMLAIVIIFIILEQTFSKKSFYKMSNFQTITNLGKITYGLYSLHFIGILITLKITQFFNINSELWQIIIIETFLSLFISIIISKISYRFYEKPFLSIKNKFSFITKD